MIKIENITKVYRGIVLIYALKEVDLIIEKGDFTAVAGPSGSGKTTLLNLIGGLDRPTSGKIHVDGVEVTNLSLGQLSRLRLEKISYVFQSHNLIPVLTAMESVEFIMQLQGIPFIERQQKAREILREVGLAGLEGKRPHEMSGGQRQRVAVARAVVAEPEIILADEPTANLDSNAAAGLVDLMRALNEKKGTTFLLSTHDPLVMKKAKKVVEIRDGIIVS